jgi:hypothetical protein
MRQVTKAKTRVTRDADDDDPYEYGTGVRKTHDPVIRRARRARERKERRNET